MDKTNLPFGLWPSPLTASLISQRLRLDDVHFAGDGQTLIWLEGRSGNNVLVARTGAGAQRDLTDDPAPRAGVGYGGGDFSAVGDTLIFAARDGRLYRRGLGLERPRAITPALNSGAVASPALSPDGRWVVYVYSDGKTDLLALTGADGGGWPTQLSSGADFYMQPAWSPDGKRLAWVEWDHPNMPWDGTRLCLAELDGAPPRVTRVSELAGGPEIPVQQPLFSPDGQWLSFIEENGEWADLVLYNLASGERQVLVQGRGFDISVPAWVQGRRSMGWSPSSRLLYYIRRDGPNTSLWRVDLNGSAEQIPLEPFTSLYQLSVAPVDGGAGDRLAMIAAAPDQPDQVITWGPDGLRPAAYSMAATYDPAVLPEAREISWELPESGQAYGLYYAPRSPRYSGTGQPPAILHVHGGPTSLANNGFNLQAAYFTSRGYAYVEVNYRGSTGYGRAYRHAMRQRWGDVDVEDSAGCARALVEQKLADPSRLVIMGGSAGGYTVLNALIRYPGLFKAGVCLYGVTNLFLLDMDTHKFEAHYNASLVGPLPEAAERYHAWSPVFHAAAIRDALYIFQGSEDKVVTPNQAEEIVSALRAKNIPHRFKLYEGEGHGFRKSENIADFYKETERFLQQQVLFAP